MKMFNESSPLQWQKRRQECFVDDEADRINAVVGVKQAATDTRLAQFFRQRIRCLQRFIVTTTGIALLVLSGVAHLNRMSIPQSSRTNPAVSSDDLWHRWESFLNEQHLGDATADVAMVFKSQAKTDTQEKHNLEQKQTKTDRGKAKKAARSGFVDLLYLNNARAISLLKDDSNNASSDFFVYQQGWEAQINQAYCAIATAAAVLNSFRGSISLPQDPLYVPFPWATQRSMMANDCVKEAVLDIDSVQYAGLGLGMVPNFLNCFLTPEGYIAIPHAVDPDVSSQSTIKDIIVNALNDEDSRVMVNYDRGGIGQGDMGHGHWSPIGAYSSTIDAFLIMDVAKYKYPPVWVFSESLFGGVATLDFCSSMKRHSLPVNWNQDLATIAQELGCTPGYRGFVVIQPIDKL